MTNYCERYGETIFKVSNTLGEVRRFEGAELDSVNRQLCDKVPLDKLEERRAWRNTCLTQLAKLKKDLNKSTTG